MRRKPSGLRDRAARRSRSVSAFLRSKTSRPSAVVAARCARATVDITQPAFRPVPIARRASSREPARHGDAQDASPPRAFFAASLSLRSRHFEPHRAAAINRDAGAQLGKHMRLAVGERVEDFVQGAHHEHPAQMPSGPRTAALPHREHDSHSRRLRRGAARAYRDHRYRGAPTLAT